MSIFIEINNKKVEAVKGETVLDALTRNGIKVPTLCHLKGFSPTGACRICVVEDEKTGKLIPSCSFPVVDGMKIKSHSPRVIESRKTIVELLLANHPDDCLYCSRSGNCELQTLAEDLNIRERRIVGSKNDFHIDRSSPSIVRDPNKCILCERCVRVCEEMMGVSAIDIINRGSQSVIGTAFNKGLNTSSCVNCGQCIIVCPTGALSEKNHFGEIQTALNDPKKKVVIQYAPAISVSLAEEFDMQQGTDANGIMNAALRKIGFDYIFDTTFSADLTIMEESAELIQRVTTGGVLPMITSCCPAWIKFAEEFYPEMIPHISSCKSPMQMLGSVIKSYWMEKNNFNPEEVYSVAIMPCTAKKFEAQREEMTKNGYSDVDAVLTTREFSQFVKTMGVDVHNIEPEAADSPHGFRSSAGKLFGVSGGVTEAALRTAYFKLTGVELGNYEISDIRGLEGRKETKVKIGDLELGVAVVNGLKNAGILLDEIKAGRKDIHFIEVMACPGGCINGGGQHIGTTPEQLKARMQLIYDIDKTDVIRTSHSNPEIIELYDKFLGEPLSHKSHELLHTHYCKREVLK